jgi:hypothetical protein
LLPGTGFCRQCGAALPGASVVEGSEEPTAVLPQTDSPNTQRLQPRSTSPTISSRASSGTPRKGVVLAVLLIVAVLAIVAAAVTIIRDRNSSSALTNALLLYPGAQTIVNMTNSDGSRMIQLQTTDPLDRVESWYQKNLKPDKTVRLTSNSVILKNRKVAITLAVEDNKTNILIKQAP